MLTCLVFGTTSSSADNQYKVVHSVFNSDFINPDIAAQLQLTRGKDQALVNIALLKNDRVGGVAAEVSGEVRNLMQQRKVLNFRQIEEPGGTYYLAPVRFTHLETLHFSIDVKPLDGSRQQSLSFTKTLHVSQ